MAILIKTVVFCCCFILLAPHVVAANAEYSKSIDLSPMKMSFDDLEAVLKRASCLLSSANPQADSKAVDESVIVSAVGSSIKFQGHSLFSGPTKLPPAIYELSYCYHLPDATISGLRFRFTDSSRRIEVSGTSPEQVDAITSLLQKDFGAFSGRFGGSPLRTATGVVFAGLLSILLLSSILAYLVNRRRSVLIVTLSSVLGILGLIFFPFDEVLPGFVAYLDGSGLLVRYGPEISFLGFLCSALAIPVSYCFWMRPSRTSQDSGR